MDNKKPTRFETETRSIFHRIHVDMLDSQPTLKRLRGELTTQNLQLADDYFTDKLCVDLGCGSSVHGTFNLLKLGAKKVYGLDLVGDFVESAQAVLGGESDFSGRWQLDIGTLAALPYEDASKDFALCHGVIHHVDDDQRSLDEIARILKPGGMAHLSVLGGHGGILHDIVANVLVEHYKRDKEFAALIDGDAEESLRWLGEQIDWLIEHMDDDSSEAHEKSVQWLNLLRDLVDKDFILTVCDRLQAPLYRRYHEEEFFEMLRHAGFRSWYRITRLHPFPNIRKIISPVYAHPESPLSRLLYGPTGSNLLVMATK